MIVLGVFVLLTLSCASLTRLIVSDSLTLPFRRWVIDRFGQDSNWSTLVHCPWCASMWVGLPHVVAWGLITLDWQWWWLMAPAALAMRYLVGLLSRLEG